LHRPVAAARAAFIRRCPSAASRRAARCTASSTNGLATTSAADYDIIQRHKVLSVASGEEVALTSLWRAEPGTRYVVAFLTHWGDLSSTELAQKLLAVLPEVCGTFKLAAAAMWCQG
jgi:hypothetical protein